MVTLVQHDTIYFLVLNIVIIMYFEYCYDISHYVVLTFLFRMCKFSFKTIIMWLEYTLLT